MSKYIALAIILVIIASAEASVIWGVDHDKLTELEGLLNNLSRYLELCSNHDLRRGFKKLSQQCNEAHKVQESLRNLSFYH